MFSTLWHLLAGSGRSGRRAVDWSWACERAAAGAGFLDVQQPGWYQEIDPETMELSHGGCCVLGQLHGEFRMGLGRTSIFNLTSAPLASQSPVDLGFLCVQGVSPEEQDRDYGLLNRAWKVEVTRRTGISLSGRSESRSRADSAMLVGESEIA